jgi:hypothetical protein
LKLTITSKGQQDLNLCLHSLHGPGVLDKGRKSARFERKRRYKNTIFLNLTLFNNVEVFRRFGKTLPIMIAALFVVTAVGSSERQVEPPLTTVPFQKNSVRVKKYPLWLSTG